MDLICTYNIPSLPLAFDVETKEILKQLSKSRSALAELKGFARVIPNEVILISTLTLQEAKDSSAVENIVTTHDELYKADLNAKDYVVSASTKEVLNYREAIQIGFSLVRAKGLLTNGVLKQIQERLEGNKAGFRTTSGTTLKDSQGNIIYIPPQDADTINNLMANLERFINDEDIHTRVAADIYGISMDEVLEAVPRDTYTILENTENKTDVEKAPFVEFAKKLMGRID